MNYIDPVLDPLSEGVLGGDFNVDGSENSGIFAPPPGLNNFTLTTGEAVPFDETGEIIESVVEP